VRITAILATLVLLVPVLAQGPEEGDAPEEEY